MKIGFVYALIALVALSGVSRADDHAFESTAAKNAKADHDKAVDKAREAYKQALANLDNAYVHKLDQLKTAPQVQKTPGEADRIDKAEAAVAIEIHECADKNYIVTMDLPKPDQPGVKLRKGMTKADLIALFPRPPKSDTTNADGNEIVEWYDPGSGSNNTAGFVGVQFDPNRQALTPQAPYVPATDTAVTLLNGVVTDFTIETIAH